MSNKPTWLVFAAILLSLIYSCSGKEINPITPNSDSLESLNPSAGSNELWGYYDVYIDTQTHEITATLNRSAMATINVVKYLNEQSAGLEFSYNGSSAGTNYFDVDMDITIIHPLNASKHDGYDVRGVIIGNGSGTMKYNSDLKYPVVGTDQILKNADGYTRWCNPTEFTHPGIWGYTPGKLALPGYTGTATLNPYKYYGQGLDAKEDLWAYLNSGDSKVGYFLHGTYNTRNYQLRFAQPNPGIKFNYAILASWNGEAPQFHPAHSAESPGVHTVITGDVYYASPTDNGGAIILDINVFDWFATPTDGTMHDYQIVVESTVLSSPHIFTDVQMKPSSGSGHCYTYHAEIPADNVTGVNNNDLWIIIEYPGVSYSNPAGVPNSAINDSLMVSSRFSLSVLDHTPIPWINIISPQNQEEIQAGTDYEIQWQAQYYTGTVNIEYSKDNFVSDTQTISLGVPNQLDDSEIHCSYLWENVPADYSDNTQLRISKSDNSSIVGYRNFRIINIGGWARTWGVSEDEVGEDVAVDQNGNAYVVGHNDGGMLLTKINYGGQYQWTLVWDNGSLGENIVIDNLGNFYIVGRGGVGVFVTKLTPSCSYLWTRTWNAQAGPDNLGISIDPQNNIYVSGRFNDLTDFDPGPDTSNHIPVGNFDAFISKFNPNGDYLWTIQWGGTGYDTCPNIYVSSDGIFATGTYNDLVDFDPGLGVYNCTALGFNDYYVVAFNHAGNFEWVNAKYGGDEDENGVVITGDDYGNIYIAGNRPYLQLPFLLKFGPNGGLIWGLNPYELSAIYDIAINNNQLYIAGSAVITYGPYGEKEEIGAIYSTDSAQGEFSWFHSFPPEHPNIGPWGRGCGIASFDDDIYITGFFRSKNSKIDFAPNESPCNEPEDFHFSSGYDMFLCKFLPDGCW